MDLCGDDWSLMQLLNIGGEQTSTLLQQQASRADGLRPDIKEAAEILSGNQQKSKKRGNDSIVALSLPQRIPTLLVGGNEAQLPVWKQKRIPKVDSRPARGCVVGARDPQAGAVAFRLSAAGDEQHRCLGGSASDRGDPRGRGRGR